MRFFDSTIDSPNHIHEPTCRIGTDAALPAEHPRQPGHDIFDSLFTGRGALACRKAALNAPLAFVSRGRDQFQGCSVVEILSS